ncbi:OmpA family protein [Shewanella kaireitica]|uniref:OmpA family protein n=1 Tax=Shewanella kaireitica TaxID=212021 RepID=UPI0020100035|nr:OmpA family protein [Shewanella kaireitica]MCL1093539.1 OmpA family protein [Shewanella kaireitica]
MRWLILVLGVYILAAGSAYARDWHDSDADGVPDKKDACAQSQLGQRVDASGCAYKALATTLCLRTITGVFYPASCTQLSSNIVKFEFAKSELLSSQRAVLERISAWLTHVPARLLLVGYTDSIGGEAFNQRLSLLRAKSVKQALITEFDFEPDRFDIKGVGSQAPIANNHTGSGRALNRRVEFFVVF